MLQETTTVLSVIHRAHLTDLSATVPAVLTVLSATQAEADLSAVTVEAHPIMVAALSVEEASAVAVQAGISSGVGMNRRFSCTAQAELSNALDKISQLCYNDENQFREGVIRV